MTAALDLTPWVGACTSCGAQIVWATTGREAIPINPQPSVDGNTVLTVQYELGGGQQLVATVLTSDRVVTARARGMTLHTTHFSDCPYADQHRKRRTR
ncbi:MAG: hypothetical protein GEU83_12015 [Pseudonocardiaceae bacterium]|nr:hypothetical protein [Pseudonocardiaceae bacterium]